MDTISWVGLDWGTSNLRAFAVGEGGDIVDERSSEKGMGKLEPTQFEPALLELIEPWLTEDRKTKIFACGMVGARQGWFEAQYREVPCQPVSADGLTQVPTQDDRIGVYILPGLSQRTPADVMRGEETQIAGLLARDPDFSGAVCLPGTHSKWVMIKNGRVGEFTTFMTGEMFDIVSKHSVLKHSVTSGAWDSEAFLEAAQVGISKPAEVAEKLFSLRAGSLLADVPSQTARAQLSGYLIGQELGLASRYWRSGKVALIGSTDVVHLYQQVLDATGCTTQIEDIRSATLSGLTLAATETLHEHVHA